MQFNFYPNKSLTADVHIRVRGSVIQVPIEKPCISTVVPVTTELGKRALYIPIFFNC